jgi:hypothetical protein
MRLMPRGMQRNATHQYDDSSLRLRPPIAQKRLWRREPRRSRRVDEGRKECRKRQPIESLRLPISTDYRLGLDSEQGRLLRERHVASERNIARARQTWTSIQPFVACGVNASSGDVDSAELFDERRVFYNSRIQCMILHDEWISAMSEDLESVTGPVFAGQDGVGRAIVAGAAGGGFLPGTVLGGRYRMIGLLGRGGMGEVYRADDLKLGQPVALKFLSSDLERDPGQLDRFLNEVGSHSA